MPTGSSCQAKGLVGFMAEDHYSSTAEHALEECILPFHGGKSSTAPQAHPCKRVLPCEGMLR